MGHFRESQPPWGRARAQPQAIGAVCWGGVKRRTCHRDSRVCVLWSACLGWSWCPCPPQNAPKTKLAGQNTNQSPLFSHGRVPRRRFREANRAIGRPGWASGASGGSKTSLASCHAVSNRCCAHRAPRSRAAPLSMILLCHPHRRPQSGTDWIRCGGARCCRLVRIRVA
jgi:hypothetical protein